MHELPIAHVNVSTWSFTFHHVDPCRCKIYMESEKVYMAIRYNPHVKWGGTLEHLVDGK